MISMGSASDAIAFVIALAIMIFIRGVIHGSLVAGYIFAMLIIGFIIGILSWAIFG
jgi:hypothetical protein